MAGLAFQFTSPPNLQKTAAGALGQARLRGALPSRHAASPSVSLKATASVFGAAAAVSAVVQGAARRSRHAKTRIVKVSRAVEQSSVASALELVLNDVTEAELEELFEIAGGGRDEVTFDEVLSLDGIDGVLEEGATTEDELLVLWGEEDKSMNFENFCSWYRDVLQLYDDFLTQGAVTAPAEALYDDDDAESLLAAADEDLIEDKPTYNVDLGGLDGRWKRPVGQMKFGTLTDLIPGYDAQSEKEAEDWAAGRTFTDELPQRLIPKEKPDTAGLAAPGPGGRDNVEVTALFRKATNESNLLGFEALKEISEFEELLKDEELSEDELREMFNEFPQQDGKINILAFRDLLMKVDEMFEYVDEDEEEEQAIVKGKTDFDLAQRKKRNIKNVRDQMLEIIYDLLEGEKLPLGLDGREETCAELVKVCAELEDLWRDEAGDLKDWDGMKLCGDWELIYSTSTKFRRWGNILNSFEDVLKRGKYSEAILESFGTSEGDNFNEYDLEEVFVDPDTKQENAIRATGAWRIGLSQNVVTGQEDIRLKIGMAGAEYDDYDDRTKEHPRTKSLDLMRMVRTYQYSYLGYIDADYRVMRTGLTGKAVWIYQRMNKEEALVRVSED